MQFWEKHRFITLSFFLLLCWLMANLLSAPALAAEKRNIPNWEGVWATNRYGHELRLQQIGEFVYGVIEGGRVAGIADTADRTFYGTWYIGSGDGSMGLSSGPVRLVLSADNKSFTGWWDIPETIYNGTLTSKAYGKWETSWETSYGKMWLQRSDDNIWGGYEQKNGSKGQLSGTVKGNVLSGTWQEGREWGLFGFTMNVWGDNFTGWRNTSSIEWNGQLRSNR